MAGYSARQSSYSDGDTITAAHTNDEFNQILAAFNVSTGHTHDGSTAGDGGPISKLFSNAITFGTGADTDIAITFDGNTSDGVLTWMEDEDYFQFSDDILLSTTEKLQFRDTAIYIHSSADGQLDLIADTEIQIAATTVDINGNVDVSGTLTVAGAVDFGDAALSNVGAVQLDSIAGDGDTDTSITFSGSDVITIAAGGANQVTFTNGAIVPSTDNDIDLGTSSVEFKDAFFDGTVTSDAFAGPLTGDVTGNVSGTAATVTGAAQSNITSLGTLTTLTVDDITINGSTISDGGDFTLDVNGDITLDANGGDILFKDDGTTFGSATNTSGNLIIKSGTTTALTFSGANVTVAGDLTISGDDLVMGTNTAGHILVADGTNFNPVAVGDLSEISTVANDDVFLAVDTSGGGLKKIARSAVVSGLASSAAISNVVEDTTPQLGGDLDINSNNIIGTGGISRAHQQAYQKAGGFEIVAVCDIFEEKAKKAAEEWGVPAENAFTNIEQMLNSVDLDTISVCTYNQAHKDPTIAALKAGKHVFCEKPMAATLEDATEMVKVAKSSGKVLQIGIHSTFSSDLSLIHI